MEQSVKFAKKMIISVVGITIILFGIALLFLPGPGWLIIMSGLFLLASEYLWARRAFDYFKHRFQKSKGYVKKLVS
jgi:uncharacterized protein (TIGR02611 family)